MSTGTHVFPICGRAALWYGAHLGVPVLPADSLNKRPLPVLGRTGRRHLNAASRDPRELIDMWQRWPRADVAAPIATVGVVLDVDTKHGFDGHDTLFDLEQQIGALPETPRIRTPSGGSHFLFRHGPCPPAFNAVGVLGPGIDVLVTGLVFLPPSTGRMWYLDARPEELPLAPWPVEWSVAVRDAKRPVRRRLELSEVIPNGQRNETLFSLLIMCRRRVTTEQLRTLALHVNQTRCLPPLPIRIVDEMVRRVASWRPRP